MTMPYGQPPYQQPPYQQPPQFSMSGAWSFGAKLITPRFIWLPIALIIAGFIPSVFLGLFISPMTALTEPPTQAEISRFLGLAAIGGVFSLWSSATYVVAIALVLLALVGMTRGEAPAARLEGRVFGLALRLVGAYLLLFVATIPGFIVLALLVVLLPIIGILAIPFAWFASIAVMIRLSLTPVLMAEGMGIMDAYRESWRLSKGSAWQIFGWLFVTGLVFGLGVSIVVLPSSIIFPALGTLVSAVVGALLLPIWLGVVVTLTHACRWYLAGRSGSLGPQPAATWPTYEPPTFDSSAPQPPAPGEDSGRQG